MPVSPSEGEIPKYVDSEPVRNLANAIHFVTHHANNIQVFHTLRVGVKEKDHEKFNGVISIVLDTIRREKGSEDFKKWWEKLSRRGKLPSQDDVREVQRLFSKYGKELIMALLARASAPCDLCFEKLKGGS